MLLLGIWLIVMGLSHWIHFDGLPVLLAVLAIAAGAFILVDR